MAYSTDKVFGSVDMPNGDTYVGEYKGGYFHGQGTLAFADGGKYVGGFKDGEPNGQGTYTDANGNS